MEIKIKQNTNSTETIVSHHKTEKFLRPSYGVGEVITHIIDHGPTKEYIIIAN